MNPYGVINLPWYSLFGLLVLVHFWYDYHIQGAYISAGKRESNWLLSVHASTWALAISVPLYATGLLTPLKFLFLLGTHWITDWWKCHKWPNTRQFEILDQFVHIVTLWVCIWP